MLHTVLKVLQLLILPPSVILFLMGIGLLMTTRRKKRPAGMLLIGLGFLLLYAFSITPVSESLMAPLEARVPPLADRAVAVDRIVVLGGGVTELGWLGIAPEPSALSLERLVEGVTLYRVVQKPLVLSGGAGLPVPGTAGEADAMARAARNLGVPEQDIVVENTSRYTLESARAVRTLLKDNRILLVTSAFHMQRAAAMFRRQGFEVFGAPVGYRSEQKQPTYFSFIPRADNMTTSSTALAEHLSLMWYSLMNEL